MESYYTECLLSKPCIGIVLAVWTVFVIVSLTQMPNVKVDLRQSYFIANGAYIKKFMERSENYFSKGNYIEFMFDLSNQNVSFFTHESQLKLKEFDKLVKNCDGCKDDYTYKLSYSSWYESFLKEAKSASN